MDENGTAVTYGSVESASIDRGGVQRFEPGDGWLFITGPVTERVYRLRGGKMAWD